MKQLFAAIADDFTGGSDLAGMLFEAGVATVQMFGLPSDELLERTREAAQAVVLSLKSRSIPASNAVDLSLKAHRALQTLHSRQIYFKYCSTFDSTAEGNIGPVTQALLKTTGTPFTIAVPALPVNGRTQYLGHLFVNGSPLSESPMRHHPLNPMDDSNLVRHLQKQTSLRVGLIDLTTVQAGPVAVRLKANELQSEGNSLALVDAVSDADLDVIAEAFLDAPLLTGGSGLARPLAARWDKATPLAPAPPAAAVRTLILAGSCSAATLTQLASYRGKIFRLGDDVALDNDGVAAVASSADPSHRDTAPGAAARIEQEFGRLARHAHDNLGVRNFIVAGGETSGAVVEALGVKAARIAGIVAPGVPALQALGFEPLTLILKSGNFGGPNFFQDALNRTTAH